MDKTKREHLFSISGVVGVGYGFKEVEGKRTDEEAIVILVKEKLPPEKIPQDQLLPKFIDDRKTDVIEVGHIIAHGINKLLKVTNLFDPLIIDLFDPEYSEMFQKQVIIPETSTESRTSRVRPASPGVSIGHYLVTAGTLGAIVYEKNGQPLILSNNHVLANSSNGKDRRARIGDLILQPGVYDGGLKSANAIAKLYKYVALANYPAANRMDCALAKPLKNNLVDPKIMEIGKVEGVRPPSLGMTVQKSGRSSGITTGEIRALEVSVNVDYGQGRVLRFENQILTTAMSVPGDSGSLVLDMNNSAIGLLFAGSDTTTVMNPIQEILDVLKVKF